MRLVDADAIRKEHCDGCDISIQQGCLSDPVCATLMWVDEAPTIDAVEVVRCKDCKWRGDYGCPMYYEEYIDWDDDGYHEWDCVEHDRTDDEGFCDRGERQEDEENY